MGFTSFRRELRPAAGELGERSGGSVLGWPEAGQGDGRQQVAAVSGAGGVRRQPKRRRGGGALEKMSAGVAMRRPGKREAGGPWWRRCSRATEELRGVLVCGAAGAWSSDDLAARQSWGWARFLKGEACGHVRWGARPGLRWQEEQFRRRDCSGEILCCRMTRSWRFNSTRLAQDRSCGAGGRALPLVDAAV